MGNKRLFSALANPIVFPSVLYFDQEHMESTTFSLFFCICISGRHTAFLQGGFGMQKEKVY